MLRAFILVIVFMAVSGETDPDILKPYGGLAFIVIIVILTVTVLLILVLLAKRQLLRILLTSKRGAHTTIASGAPRTLAREIEARIKRVERLKIEPRTLSENLQMSPGELLRSQTCDSSMNNLYNLRYRFKAIDSTTYLDDLLCSIDVRYCRKNHQTLRDHLTVLQHPPQSPLSGCEATCENVIKLYEHARYGKKEFGQQEYEELASHIEDLKTRLRQKVTIPGTLVSTDTTCSSKEVTGPGTLKNTTDKSTSVIYGSSGEMKKAFKV